MKKNLRNDIINILTQGGEKRRPISFRSEEEARFLRQWLESQPAEETSEEAAVDLTGLSPRERLEKTIEACSACGEVRDKRSGYGDGSNGVMVILHSPRLIDRVERDILKKESIDLLQKMLSAIDLEMDRCYITSMIKCETDDIFIRPSEMVEHCHKILLTEVEVMAPRIVLVMGDMQPIQKIVHDSSGITWFTTEHPLTILKNPDLKRPAWQTLQNIKAEISGTGS